MLTSRRTGIAAALMVSLIAGAMGGLGGVDPLSGGVAGATGATSGPSAAQKAQAHHDVLVLSDLPRGWQAKPRTAGSRNSGGFAADKKFAACLKVPERVTKLSAYSAKSATFVNEDGTQQVNDSVSIFPSEAVGRTEMASISSPEMPGCLESLLRTISSGSPSGHSGTSIEDVHVVRDASPPGSTSYLLSATVSNDGQSLPVSIELVRFVHDDLGGTMELTSTEHSSIPPSTADHLIRTAQSRLLNGTVQSRP